MTTGKLVAQSGGVEPECSLVAFGFLVNGGRCVCRELLVCTEKGRGIAALPIAVVRASGFAANTERSCPWALACATPSSAAQAMMMICFEFILVWVIV